MLDYPILRERKNLVTLDNNSSHLHKPSSLVSSRKQTANNPEEHNELKPNSNSKQNSNADNLEAKTINTSSSPKHNKWLHTAKIWAKIFDSRASTQRAAMDLIGCDLPTALGGLRNFYNFCEAFVEATISFLMIFGAPKITTVVAKIIGKFLLPKDKQKDVLNYLLFHSDELREEDKFVKAIDRVQQEEVKDKQRIADLYKELDNKKMVQEFEGHAQDIDRFCIELKNKYTHSNNSQTQTQETSNNSNQSFDEKNLMETITKLKKAVLLGESFIEGGIWGSFGLTLRLFRKYVLRQKSFTGTQGYTNEKESKKIGDDEKLSIKKLLSGLFCVFLSPLTNLILLNLTKDPEKIKKSKVLQFIDKQMNMTHGIYPKLGLMFTFTTFPKWTSVFLTTQGRNEFLERLAKFVAMVPLWWLGHKVTNGPIAAFRDKYLSKKYQIEPGLLVDRDKNPSGLFSWLNYIFPETKHYHDVWEKVKNSKNENLKQEATDLHARTVYEGLGLHSLIMFTLIVGSQLWTKLRVKKELKKA